MYTNNSIINLNHVNNNRPVAVEQHSAVQLAEHIFVATPVEQRSAAAAILQQPSCPPDQSAAEILRPTLQSPE